MNRYLIILSVLFIFIGCSGLLPSNEKKSISQWNSYKDVEAAYNYVINYETSRVQLHNLGFDPFKTANIKILSYLDIMKIFLINSSISVSDLDKGLQECIINENRCIAYETKVEEIEQERYGNALMDLLNFRRKTRVTGWSFYSLIVINDGMVVYKVYRGDPNIDSKEDQKNPLGPFQSMESILRSGVY